MASRCCVSVPRITILPRWSVYFGRLFFSDFPMNIAPLHRLILSFILLWAAVIPSTGRSDPAPAATQAAGESFTLIPADDPGVGLAPYVWKITGDGDAKRAEATMPGAYLKTNVEKSASIALMIDGNANKGCPPASMPIVDYSIDHGPWQTKQLTITDAVYPLVLAEQLDRAKQYHVEFYFRSANLGPNRWRESTVHLRIAGMRLDAGGSAVPGPKRSHTAIGFGDSITEGVCVEGLCPYYSNLLMNNARVTCFPLVCAALDCEYGQLGTGGQGMVKHGMEMPPLPQSWDHFDATTSRLTDGLLKPEPDYVFCAMGTNDFQENPTKPSDITVAYTSWLEAVRKAAPHSAIFCIVPPLGWHAAEVAAAVAARNQAGDPRAYLIDTARFKDGYAAGHATEFAPDGVHPSEYGNALLAALISSEAQKALSKPN